MRLLFLYRSLLATLLILSMAFTVGGGRFWIALDYKLHTSRYAEQCENKSKPMLHCHGKCQMMKQMMAVEQKEQQKPAKQIELVAEFMFTNYTCEISHPILFSTSHQRGFPQVLGYPIRVIHPVFHPPKRSFFLS